MATIYGNNDIYGGTVGVSTYKDDVPTTDTATYRHQEAMQKQWPDNNLLDPELVEV